MSKSELKVKLKVIVLFPPKQSPQMVLLTEKTMHFQSYLQCIVYLNLLLVF